MGHIEELRSSTEIHGLIRASNRPLSMLLLQAMPGTGVTARLGLISLSASVLAATILQQHMATVTKLPAAGLGSYPAPGSGCVEDTAQAAP